MSFWDNVKKFTQPYADDDYDDFDDTEDLFSAEDTARPTRRSGNVSAEPSFRAGTEEPAFNGKVLNMSSNKPGVVLFRPIAFSDAVKAADELRERKAVIVNLENLDKTIARRVVDFLSGCSYALEGSVKKVAAGTYLFCPHNMDVAGDLGGIHADSEIGI